MTPERKQFTIFLLRKKAHNKYGKAVHSKVTPSSVREYIESQEAAGVKPIEWIMTAFDWGETTEGSVFWGELDELWQAELDEPKPLTLYKLKDYE